MLAGQRVHLTHVDEARARIAGGEEVGLVQHPAARRHQTQLDAELLQAGESKTARSEEHTSELQSLMRISYAVFCLKKKKVQYQPYTVSHYQCPTELTSNISQLDDHM